MRSITLPGCSTLPLRLPCTSGLELLKAVLESALMLLLSCWHQERKTRTVPQTISVSVIAPQVSSAQTPCDDTLQHLLRPRTAMTLALQPTELCGLGFWFFILMVNY